MLSKTASLTDDVLQDQVRSKSRDIDGLRNHQSIHTCMSGYINMSRRAGLRVSVKHAD